MPDQGILKTKIKEVRTGHHPTSVTVGSHLKSRRHPVQAGDGQNIQSLTPPFNPSDELVSTSHPHLLLCRRHKEGEKAATVPTSHPHTLVSFFIHVHKVSSSGRGQDRMEKRAHKEEEKAVAVFTFSSPEWHDRVACHHNYRVVG